MNVDEKKLRELLAGLEEDHACGDFGRALAGRVELLREIIDEGQPAPEDGLREFVCDECGSTARTSMSNVRCDAPVCEMRDVFDEFRDALRAIGGRNHD